MGKKNLLLITAIAALFLAAGIAIAAAPDVIPMKTAGYEKHEKGIVQFTHTKHATDYGTKCGDCHHDKDGKPLNDLKLDDPVQKCVDCHSKIGEVPKDVKKEWREKKLKKAEQNKLELEYHAEALHANCLGCHKDYNKTNKTKAAPTTCANCHPKTAE